MPQEASKVSSGRPYKKRNTVRSRMAPTMAAAMNDMGTASQM